MQRYAIIVAGGRGSRMNNDIPKQFIPLHGLPVLMHTINQYFKSSIGMRIIVVLPENEIDTWRELCSHHLFQIPHDLVPGGIQRFDSVKNGLEHIVDSDGLVAIHDGVRPLVSTKIINTSYEVAAEKGNAIVAVPLKDSIRIQEHDQNHQVDRTKYHLIQTPQTFRIGLIKSAFDTEYKNSFTDDASVLEAAGESINLIEGDYRNIKITTPEDLIIAEAFLNGTKD